ncbi:hypothetical protein GEMRC1_004857 [Eukaryota sp. GEM-RC1]
MSEHIGVESSLTVIKPNYSMFNVLGSGHFKSVHHAFNNDTGVEVALHSIPMDGYSSAQRKNLEDEVSQLRNLDHPNIISIHDLWQENGCFVYITDLMTSGNLRQYIQRVGKLSTTAIKSLSRQILSALVYLHSQAPRIVLEGIALDKIFINGHSSQIKLGDFGISKILRKSQPPSSHPELEVYQLIDVPPNLIDVHSFGLIVLEMATGDPPYAECVSPADMWSCVEHGILPESLKTVDRTLRPLIELCLLPPQHRPSAATVLNLPFFDAKDMSALCPGKAKFSKPLCGKASISPNGAYLIDFALPVTEGQPTSVEFAFDPNSDTVEEVVSEMIGAFELDPKEHDDLADRIGDLIHDVEMQIKTQQPTPNQSPQGQKSLLETGFNGFSHNAVEVYPHRVGDDDRPKYLSAPVPSRPKSPLCIEHQYEIERKKYVDSGVPVSTHLTTDEEAMRILMLRHELERQQMLKNHERSYFNLRSSLFCDRSTDIRGGPSSRSAPPRSCSRSPDSCSSASGTGIVPLPGDRTHKSGRQRTIFESSESSLAIQSLNFKYLSQLKPTQK